MHPAPPDCRHGGALTVILPSSSLTGALPFFQDTAGSGWPRGGTHSITAGSPTATTRFPGDCRKSSRRTGGRERGNGNEQNAGLQVFL